MLEEEIKKRFQEKLGALEKARKSLQETMGRLKDGTIGLGKAQALKGMAAVEVDFFRAELQILYMFTKTLKEQHLLESKMSATQQLLVNGSTDPAEKKSQYEEVPETQSPEDDPVLLATPTGYMQRVVGDDGIVRQRHTLV